jgi:hypothetical protein
MMILSISPLSFVMHMLVGIELSVSCELFKSMLDIAVDDGWGDK